MGVSRRALIVPDDRSWLLWGRDLRGEGYVAAASPAAADVLIAPERVPASLGEPLREAWSSMPLSRELVVPADPIGVGDHTRDVLADAAEPDGDHASDVDHTSSGGGDDAHAGHGSHGQGAEGIDGSEGRGEHVHHAEMHHGHAEHEGHPGEPGGHAQQEHGAHDMHAGGEHDMHAGHGGHQAHAGHGDHDMHAGHDTHGGHGGHDHHAMMAVTGDPSADGLVMEDLEFELGPLAPVLPGGLVARLALDGDVVCKAELRPALDAAGAPIPDPTAAAAWRAALGYAAERAQGRAPTAETRRGRLISVELERAVSHSAWFADLGDLLGWPELGDAGRESALAVLAVTPEGDGLAAAVAEARSLARLVDGSRRLAFRLDGLAPLSLRDVDRLAIAGPNARAAGLAIDARMKDPAYSASGFTPSVDQAGDAAARARVRVRELVAALDLAGTAVGASFDVSSTVPDAVEGPRGPIAVHVASEGEPCTFVAQGAHELLEAVAERLEGLEWAAAMAAIASFDLSGWKVPS